MIYLKIKINLTGAVNRRGYDDTSGVVCYDVEDGDERT